MAPVAPPRCHHLRRPPCSRRQRSSDFVVGCWHVVRQRVQPLVNLDASSRKHVANPVLLVDLGVVRSTASCTSKRCPSFASILRRSHAVPGRPRPSRASGPPGHNSWPGNDLALGTHGQTLALARSSASSGPVGGFPAAHASCKFYLVFMQHHFNILVRDLSKQC